MQHRIKHKGRRYYIIGLFIQPTLWLVIAREAQAELLLLIMAPSHLCIPVSQTSEQVIHNTRTGTGTSERNAIIVNVTNYTFVFLLWHVKMSAVKMACSAIMSPFITFTYTGTSIISKVTHISTFWIDDEFLRTTEYKHCIIFSGLTCLLKGNWRKIELLKLSWGLGMLK